MIGLWFLGGIVWGVVMIRWQRWSVDRLEGDTAVSTAAFGALAGALARLVGSALLLIWALQTGIWPALALFAGWWLGRWIDLARLIS